MPYNPRIFSTHEFCWRVSSVAPPACKSNFAPLGDALNGRLTRFLATYQSFLFLLVGILQMQYRDSGTLLDTPRRFREKLEKTFGGGTRDHSSGARRSNRSYYERSAVEHPDPYSRDSICYRPVRSRSDLMNAFRLLQQRYEATGLAPATPNQGNSSYIRMMPYHGWLQSQVFVAAIGERIIGTVTLVLDGEHDLPMAEYFPDEIRAAREIGNVGEITSLAVDPVHPKSAEIFGQLTRILTFFARHHRMDFLAATVHPRHAEFYQHAMGFQLIGDEIRCDQVGGKPGVAVLGNVNDQSKYRKRWQDYYFSGNFPVYLMEPRFMSSDEFRDCQSVVDQQRLHTEICNGVSV